MFLYCDYVICRELKYRAKYVLIDQSNVYVEINFALVCGKVN